MSFPFLHNDFSFPPVTFLISGIIPLAFEIWTALNVDSYIKSWIVLVIGHLQSDMQYFMWFANKISF